MASLKSNTFFLYLLTASNYVFGIVTIPFITRVLGPEVYGDVGFAIAVSTYFFLIIDFGFSLSATQRVATNSNDLEELSKIFSSVCVIKCLLFVILLALLLLIAPHVTVIKSNLLLLILYLILSLVSCLLPDYIYRGLENMKWVTVRGVITRGVFTSLIFIFLRKPSQAYMVPSFQIIGSVIALIWVFYHLYFKLNIRLTYTPISHVIKIAKESATFFVSRIAGTIYNATNVVVLGIVMPGSSIIGYYTSADKFKSLAAQGFSPVADSFYPYMIRSRDYQKLIRTTLLLEVPIIVMCAIAFVWAQPICEIAFGASYTGSYILLRWMLPTIAITLPVYMFGFPALTPLGKSKWANYSVVISMINQLIGLSLLFFLNKVTAVNICILTFFSEFICLLIRLISLYSAKRHVA